MLLNVSNSAIDFRLGGLHSEICLNNTIGESNRLPQVNEFAKTYMPTGDEEATVEGSSMNMAVPAGDGSHQNNNLAR